MSPDREHEISMARTNGRSAPLPATLKERLSSLQQEDEMLYNILAVDIWALAKTMDEFQPGFWAAFMKNREKSLKPFLAEMMKHKAATSDRPTATQRHPFLG